MRVFYASCMANTTVFLISSGKPLGPQKPFVCAQFSKVNPAFRQLVRERTTLAGLSIRLPRTAH
jgi:hypothetical protein